MRKTMITSCMFLAACGQTGTTPAARDGSPLPAQDMSSVEQAPTVATSASTPAAHTNPDATNAQDTGAIVGTLAYPGEALPAMRVCAFELAEGASRCISSTPGQRAYRIDGVARGDYLVLAYPRDGSGAPGGYTGCVDDLSASCTDHDLRVVVVEAGQTTHDIDPADFYAGDAGVDWPAEP